MKLFKIVLFFFAVYFIRRFFQMYKVMKEIQKKQNEESLQKTEQPSSSSTDKKDIDVDFKIIDR